MKTLVDDKIYKFNSIADCARFIRRSHSFVLVRLKRPEIVYSDGIVIKGDDNTDWPAVPEKLKSISVKRSVIVRDIFKDEYHVFGSLDAAGKFCGCTGTTVFNHCATEKIEAKNGYNFRFVSETMRWPNHNLRHLEIYSEHLKSNKNLYSGIVICDENDNELMFYPSLLKASIALGITEGTLSTNATSGYVHNGKICKRYRLTENLGPVIEKSMNVKGN